MNLYDITHSIEVLLERAIGPGGEVLDEQLDAELEQLEADRDKRALHVACAIRDYEGEAAKIKQRADELREWAAQVQRKADRLTAYLQANVPEGHKIQDDRVRVSWRKSERVVLDCDPVELPDRLQRVTVAADLAQLKQELKCGDSSEYAHLEQRQSVQIK